MQNASPILQLLPLGNLPDDKCPHWHDEKANRISEPD
jgi:hypothetical protein